MSGTSSVPEPTFGPNGFIIPSETDILAGRQADINAAFGGGLNPALETPQGQLASSDTAVIGAKNDQFLLITQGVDPKYSQGRMQDGIGRLYFIERLPAQPTIVQATCTGLTNMFIPAGSLAEAQDGNTYITPGGGSLGLTGSAVLTFECVLLGPIPCSKFSLNKIANLIPGWDSILNNDDGVLGRNVESRLEFETRRTISVAKNSVGTLSAIQGTVLGVGGVLDAYTTENNTDNDLLVDNIIILHRSLYVCVVGGTDSDVAQAIWTKKGLGVNYSGNTTVTVQDTQSGYSPPYPSYSISFQRPAGASFFFEVRLANNITIPSDALTQIQNALVNAFAGADGGPRARIGSTVYASRYYAPIVMLGPWVQLIELEIAEWSDALDYIDAEFNAEINDTVMNVTIMGTSGDPGQILLGAFVVGPGVPDGVRIVSFGTGTGGVGTYNLNLPQTIVAQTMWTVTPNHDFLDIGIAHAPTLSPANISLVLI